uniref:cytochrome c553 n=1 Tax=Rhodospora sordida TaxID=362230 RepID=UPI001FCDFF59|nr:cytochrome c553 [Rhodospora sordida]UNJ14938.1 cytochrome c553 [Rhodospora sordida]
MTSLVLILMVSASALAVDIEHGEQIFSANCAACHSGGNNIIVPERTLKKEALEQYEMKSVGAITYQVTNGKNSMPAFGDRLNDQDINDVANYVLSQADSGW